MSSRKKRFFGAVSIDALSTPVTIILGMLVTPAYFIFLSNEEFGFWTTNLEFFNLLMMLNAGIGFYLVQTISGEKTRSHEETKQILSSLAVFQLIVLMIMSLLALSLFWLMPSFKDLKDQNSIAGIVYFLMAINLIISSICQFHAGVISGQNKVVHANAFTLSRKLITQTFPLGFLFIGFGLIAFPAAYLTANIAILLISIVLTFGYLKNRLSIKNFRLFELKKITVFSFRSFLGSAGFYVLNFTDNIVIANYLTNTHVTIYALTMKLGNLLKFIPSRIYSVSYPVIAQLINEKSYDRLHDLTLKFFRFGLRFGLTAFSGIFLINEVFVNHWVGSDKFGGVYLSLFSGIICLRESIFHYFSNIIYSTKSIKWLNYILFVEAIFNLTLSLILVNIWGINGVALATVLSTSVVSLSYGIFKASNIIKLSLWRYLPSVLSVTIRLLPTLAVLVYAHFYLSSNFSWLAFFIFAAAVGLVNIICFEGIVILKNRNLPMKELISKIIESA